MKKEVIEASHEEVIDASHEQNVGITDPRPVEFGQKSTVRARQP
jgi:hypothetical protein